jgi:uncharacterized protein YbjT (DUF2867 family)/membrane protease YdiL (CAAX protease family)
VKVLVAGASGFVGRRLTAALAADGHQVIAMTRHPDTYDHAGQPIFGDVYDPATLPDALQDCEVGYYLVHSLSERDFARKDARAAQGFGLAAAGAGLRRIIYLGGLGDDSDVLSAHLRSRREVEKLLGAGGVPVTVLRAGIIIGNGGTSWELTRQLVEHLPAMITPKWVSTRTQPIAIEDVVRYLVGVLTQPETAGRVLEAGGAEIMRYRDMLKRVAAIRGRPLPIVSVPMLTPRLSSLWLTLVTDLDPATGRSLIDSMTNEVVVRDPVIRRLIPFRLTAYDDAVRAALAEHREQRGRRTTGRNDGPIRALTRRLPVVTSDRGRRRLLAAAGLSGAALLRMSLSAETDSRRFYALTAGLASTWTASALLTTAVPVRPRGRPPVRGVAEPVLTGAATFAFFYAAARIARRSPFLRDAIGSVLRYADEGTTPAVLFTAGVNAVAEEMFFRGAVWDAARAAGADPLASSTAACTALTATTGNPALAAGGAITGAVFGRERARSGGVAAPALAHLTWSVLMLTCLPPLFRPAT